MKPSPESKPVVHPVTSNTLSVAIAVAFCALTLVACQPEPITPDLPAPDLGSPSDSITRFAVVGDYGEAGDGERAVAELVAGMEPDFIITTGDNNYGSGQLQTTDENIGQYYYHYIYNPDAPEPYRCHGQAEADRENRFFPAVGNHDYNSSQRVKPYLSFFTLPGNELNYALHRGPVDLFAIDSQDKSTREAQLAWLTAELEASTAPFKVVYFHHPPYSTGDHGSSVEFRWPFDRLGVDLVVNGHDHDYQRISVAGERTTYVVNGAGGGELRHDCGEHALDGGASLDNCYDEGFGAMWVVATETELRVEFRGLDGLVDEFSLAPRP